MTILTATRAFNLLIQGAYDATELRGAQGLLPLNISFVVLSILGNEFIRRRIRRGWWLWLVADILAATFFTLQREWWIVLLYVYFGWAAVRALGEWRRQEIAAARVSE